MARIKYVTRTFKLSTLSVMGIDLTTNEIDTRTIEMPGTISEKESLDVARDYFATREAKFAPAHVMNINYTEQLYGMDERTFLLYAEKLPPRAGNSSDVDEVSED